MRINSIYRATITFRRNFVKILLTESSQNAIGCYSLLVGLHGNVKNDFALQPRFDGHGMLKIVSDSFC